MAKQHRSDSDYQQSLELKLVQRFEEEYGFKDLNNENYICLKGFPETSVVFDIYSENPPVIGEVHVRKGPMKAAQQKKVAADILKMKLFEDDQEIEFEKYLLVCGRKEYDYLTGKSYLAAAIKRYNIQVVPIELTDTEIEELGRVTSRQDLTRNVD